MKPALEIVVVEMSHVYKQLMVARWGESHRRGARNVIGTLISS